MKKYIIIALSIITVFLISCEEATVTGVSVDKTTLALPANGTAKLTATIEPADVFGRVNWTSSNPAVATVSDGIITAVSVGTARIEAAVGDLIAGCDVTVTATVTSVTLNKTSTSLKVDETLALSATLLPAQSAAVLENLSWTSTNPAVASVDNSGKVTALSDGSANIVASIGTVTAVCSVTVYTSIPVSLMGSNYYLINVDAATANVLGSGKIAGDYRADGINNNFYVWNGLVAGTTIGTSFYGNTEGWLSMVVTGAGGWSGAAYNVKPGPELNKLKAVTDDTSGKYYLHFAIKSSTTNSYAFKLGYGASGITFVLGTAPMESTNPYGNFTRNGQWQEIEIPISYFKGKGLVYTTGMATTDLFVMLAGGTVGVKLEIDAVFIYKKP